MSDMNALAIKISALTAKNVVFDAGARVISEDGTPPPMVGILSEIDDTVLERNLEFKAGAKKINLIVAGRRLRGVLAVTPGSAEDVVGKIISREEPELLLAVLDLVSSVCGSADRLTVRSLEPEPFGKGGERGISARGLAELWQIELDETPKPAMVQFLNTNRETVSAVMHLNDGKIVSTVGDFDTLQTIWDTQVVALQQAQKKALTAEDGPQLICLEGALEDGTGAALALADDDVVLMAYPPGQFAALQNSWRALFV